MPEQTPPTSDAIDKRLAFETLISDTSAALLAAAPERVEPAVEQALERVREFFEADRCALLSVGTDRQMVNVRLASYAEGISRVAASINLAEVFPWSRHKLLVDRAPVRVARISDLPPEADDERRGWMELPIHSALTLPIETGGDIRHLIALNTVQRECEWPDSFVTRLRVLGEMLVGALDRRETFAKLREAEERVSLAADSAGAGLWTLDHRTGIFWVTERARLIFGYGPGEIIDLRRLEASVHSGDWDLVRSAIDAAREESEPLSVEYRILLPDGRERWVASRGRQQLNSTGEPEQLMGVSIDITDRRRADDELRDLSRRLIRAHEEERALLARELHDDLTQRLAVLAIDVGRAELGAPDGAQAGTMRAVREGLVRISEDVHTLAYQLHPSVLEELGLVEALRTECERVLRRRRVELSAQLEPLPAAVGKDAALCLFRVAQEALNNMIRHSGARAVNVVLRAMDGGLLLAIRDDGVGFEPGSSRESRRLGLASMRERLRLVNGSLDLESAPGHGTAVVAWVPLDGGSR